MAVTPDTEQKITSWHQSKAPSVDNWYRTALGRDAEASGKAYWENEVKTLGADEAYNRFLTAANRNGEVVNAPKTWQEASTYTGPQSVNRTTPVDDWGRNVLGRELTGQELATWQSRFADAGGKSIGDVEAVFSDFTNTFGSEVKRPMDWATASRINSPAKTQPIPTGVSTLDLNDLDRRTIDPRTETVKGQMLDLLKEGSPYIEQAKYDAMRTAAERGMLNTTMAASAGEDAAIRSALNIATPDAGYYNKASDYNTAIRNDARKWNAEQLNQFAANQQQFFNQAELQRMQQGHQLTLAQLQDATDRWKTQTQDATSRYNTDAQYKQQADNNKKSLVNNVMMNMDLSPDRKAAMLEALGEGSSARKEKQADGSYKVIPGTGLAGAVYIITDVGDELRQAATNAGADVNQTWQGAGN